MTTVDIVLGASATTAIKQIDQIDYAGDTVVNVISLGNSVLFVRNEDNTSDALELRQTIVPNVAAHSYAIDLEENANVKLLGVSGAEPGTKLDFNLLEAGAKLEMTPEFLSSATNYRIQIYMSHYENTPTTLIYDTTGLNIEDFQYPHVAGGLTAYDQIQVVGATSGEYVDGDLIFRDSNNMEVGHFNTDGLDPTLVFFEGGTMTYACFLKGTNISTLEGEVHVEDLKAGDSVLTASGSTAKVKWLGYRTLYKNRIPEKDAKRAFPVLFKRGCIADNMPHRDLIMSPGHHISFDGNLISAMNLVNGKTIVQQFDMQSFSYFHIELEQFDILLAEGVPAESYVDTGNRNMFQNAHEVAMNPDFGPAEGRPNIPGITVIRKGPVLEAIRAKLLERAAWMRTPGVQKRTG